MENMTLSDIAAVTKDHDEGFGGGMSWVLVILFLLVFGGGNMFGNKTGELGQYATAASQQQILFNQQFDALGQKINAIGDGICSSTYALNNAITTEGRALQSQLAECCCSNKEAIAQVRYDMANFANATQTAVHAEGEATRAMLQANKIESLQAQVNQLTLAQQMANVVRYPVATTYNAGANPFCGSGYCN